MVGFDPAAHLRSQGWAGEGTALRTGARARPISAVKKRDSLSGLGKDAVATFAWWENLYDTVASKKRGADGKLRTTATGIISPHGQPSSRSTSPPPALLIGERDVSAIDAAKQAAVRASLYGRFLRGPVLAPEPIETPAPEPPATPSIEPLPDEVPVETKAERKERRRLKREAKLAAAENGLGAVLQPAPAQPAELDDDAARRERKQQKRAAKAARAAATDASVDEPPPKRKKRKHVE